MEKKVFSAKDSAISWLLAFAFSQVASVVFTLIGLFIASSLGYNVSRFEEFLNGAVGYGLSMLALDAALFCVFIFYGKTRDNHIVSKPKFTKILLYIALAILAFFALYPIVSCLDRLFKFLGANLQGLPFNWSRKNYFISIISVALVPAICEELIFRGLIFKGLKKHGKVVSIFLSAIMFAIFHMSYQQLIYPFLMGLMFAVIMYYENNIIYTIIAHFVNNFISLTISYFNINLFNSHWWYIVLAVVLLIVFLTIICYFVFKNKNRQENVKFELDSKKYLIISFCIMSFIWVVFNIYRIFYS